MSSGKAATCGDGGRTRAEQEGVAFGKFRGMYTLNMVGEVMEWAISGRSREYSAQLKLLQGGSPEREV